MKAKNFVPWLVIFFTWLSAVKHPLLASTNPKTTPVASHFEIEIIDDAERDGIPFGAKMTVAVEACSGGCITVTANTWSSTKKESGKDLTSGIVEDTYPAIYSKTGYLGSQPGIKIISRGVVETVDVNPLLRDEHYIKEVYVRCGGLITRDSEGDITIKKDECQKVWDILPDGSTGIVTIKRNKPAQICANQDATLSCLKKHISSLAHQDYARYSAILNSAHQKAIECNDLKKTAEYIETYTMQGLPVETSEGIHEDIENLALAKPQCFLDATLLLEKKQQEEIIAIISAPFLDAGENTDKSLSPYRDSPKYKTLLAPFFEAREK